MENQVAGTRASIFSGCHRVGPDRILNEITIEHRSQLTALLSAGHLS